MKPSLYKSLPLIVNDVEESLNNNEERLYKLKPGQIISPGCISLPGSVDRNGSPIIIIHTRFLSHISWMAPEDILEAAIYLATYFVQQQPEAIRNSACILVDLQDTPWHVQKKLMSVMSTSEDEIPEAMEDCDVLFESIRMVLSFFTECFPIKWGAIILYKPWWYLKWGNFGATIVTSEEELWMHVSSRDLPIQYGGSLIADKALFLRNLVARAQKEGEDSFFVKSKADARQTAKRGYQVAFDADLTNPWSILESIVSPGEEGRCKLSKEYSNCTLAQIKKYLVGKE